MSIAWGDFEKVGRQVIAVINFPPKQIGPFVSDVLVLGVYDADGEVVLAPARATGYPRRAHRLIAY